MLCHFVLEYILGVLILDVIIIYSLHSFFTFCQSFVMRRGEGIFVFINSVCFAVVCISISSVKLVAIYLLVFKCFYWTDLDLTKLMIFEQRVALLNA